MNRSGAGRNALRTSAILLAFAVVGTAMLAYTHDHTEPVIEKSRQIERLALLNQVLPTSLYDNDLLAGERMIPADQLLGTRKPSTVWIARRGGTLTGVVLEAAAPDGYAGEIMLLIGITANGAVTGVRVTAHRETPGLGDYIERTKSPWVDQFAGKSLTAPDTKRWTVRKDGGAFDARAGATITPRAIVKAVKNALIYYDRHRAAWTAEEK